MSIPILLFENDLPVGDRFTSARIFVVGSGCWEGSWMV